MKGLEKLKVQKSKCVVAKEVKAVRLQKHKHRIIYFVAFSNQTLYFQRNSHC